MALAGLSHGSRLSRMFHCLPIDTCWENLNNTPCEDKGSGELLSNDYTPNNSIPATRQSAAIHSCLATAVQSMGPQLVQLLSSQLSKLGLKSHSACSHDCWLDMQRKTIFLMGAPLPSHLDWENDELLHAPLPPFEEAESTEEVRSSTHQRPVKWRVLQTLEPELLNDHRHAFYYGPEDPNFLTTLQLVTAHSQSTYDEDSALSQFYNHSFAVHETSEISVSGLPEDEATQESETGPESLLAPTAASPDEGNVSEVPSALRITGKLSDLQDIPTARYLQSIAPQTLTVNLIVGIIAVHPPRRVVTRQWKTDYDIIELVVGDETRTGFGVNFWLSPEKVSGAKTQEIDGLRRSLTTLRPQDVVLLRTVGLSSFRERVYGQSLRGGMTKVDLLHRRLVDATDAGGFYQGGVPARSSHDDLPQKVRRVRDWVFHFVGATEVAGGAMSGMSQAQRGHRLPPDTQ